MKRLCSCVAAVLVFLVASPSLAVQPGQSSGSVTIDGRAVTLTIALVGAKENLFDESRRDTIVVLADRPLGDVAVDDDVALSLRAREGDLTALALRVDGTKLVNVAVHRAGLDGMVLLPGAWFTYAPAAAGKGGRLTLAKRESDGHSYACSVEFNGAVQPAVKRPIEEPEPAAIEPAPTPTLPPATTSTIDPKSLVPFFVAAVMQKDEAEAVKLIRLGLDANGRDQYGMPVLSWAVMMCMPKAVQALVDRGADVNVQRAPGLTVLQEAGACPQAAAILKAAGAR